MDVEDQTLAQDCNPESFTTSPAQDEYAPVIFSQKTVSHIVSIDMMSGKVCFWIIFNYMPAIYWNIKWLLLISDDNIY